MNLENPEAPGPQYKGLIQVLRHPRAPDHEQPPMSSQR